MPDNYNELLMESYKEQSFAWRHDDGILHRMASIVLPVSFAALGVPYVYDCIPPWLPILGGFTLMLFWIVLCQAMFVRIGIRFKIMNAIENSWEVPGHRHVRGIRKEIFETDKRRHYLLVPHWPYRWAFFIYSLIAMIVALLHTPDLPHFNSKNSPTIILIVIAFVILLVLIWLFRRADLPITECKSSTYKEVIELLDKKQGANQHPSTIQS